MKKIKQKITILMVSAMVITLTACKPTPEEPIVQEKNLDRLIEKAGGDDVPDNGELEEVDLSERLGIPERYISQKEYPGNRLTLNADAGIELPDFAMPLVHVKPMDFSQEFVDKVYALLVGDTPMFEERIGQSKEHYEMQILAAKQGIAETKKYREIYGDGYASLKEIEQQEERLKELEKQYKEAPESIELIPGLPEIRQRSRVDVVTGDSYGKYTGFHIAEEPELSSMFLNESQSHGKTFFVINNSNNGDDLASEEQASVTWDSAVKGATLSYIDTKLVDYNTERLNYVYDEDAGGWLSNIALDRLVQMERTTHQDYKEHPATSHIFTYKEAIKTAEKFLKDTGITDMRIKEMTLYKIMPGDLFKEVNTKAATLEMMSQLHSEIADGKHDDEMLDVQIHLEFERIYNGIPVTFTEPSVYFLRGNHNNNSVSLDDESFNRAWSYESMSMRVCSKGIISFDWSSPHTIAETVVDDSTLLPFEDIQDIFESMFRIKYDENDYNRDGEITKVKLTLRRIIEQNNIEKGLFVPVWDFYGSITAPPCDNNISFITAGASCSPGLFEVVGIPETIDNTLLTINAIDGTVIDLTKGY